MPFTPSQVINESLMWFGNSSESYLAGKSTVSLDILTYLNMQMCNMRHEVAIIKE